MSRRITVAGLRVAVLVVMLVGGCATPDGNPTPGPTVIQSGEGLAAIARVGDTATIDAADASGVWGTISLRRGHDTGGYPTNAVDPELFVVEVWVEYEPQPGTETTFGAEDWALATATDLRPVGRSIIPDPPAGRPSADWDLDPLLKGYSVESIDGGPGVIGGWLYFEVRRELQDQELVLVYRPGGVDEAVSALTVRRPAEAPDPVPTGTPDPTPAPLAYEAEPGAGFTVIADAAADELFAEVDTCTNPDAAYSLSYPDTWFTNAASGETPACSWFSPLVFEADGVGLPPEVAIAITSFEGGVGFVHEPVYTFSDDLTVDGWRAGRAEELGGLGPEGFLPPTLFTYEYRINAGEGDGLKVFVTTSNDMEGDYELNKAVLDRIVLSMRLER